MSAWRLRRYSPRPLACGSGRAEAATPAPSRPVTTKFSACRFGELIPEAARLPVHRYELANLHALNFVVTGLLGAGVAASARPDPQAKGLGEYLRSRHADIPLPLLEP